MAALGAQLRVSLQDLVPGGPNQVGRTGPAAFWQLDMDIHILLHV